MDRIGEVSRKTRETDIWARVNLDGRGEAKLDIPIGFFCHALDTFARHGAFDVEIRARGDLEVDQHHLVEDTGLVLGRAFAEALGERRGIRRIGSCLFPMDETLARAAVDISGRPYLVFRGKLPGIPLVSAGAAGAAGAASFQTDTVEDFWQAFCVAAGITLHLEILRGRSDHHKVEALFKATARALRDAAEPDPRLPDTIPSTKGVLA